VTRGLLPGLGIAIGQGDATALDQIRQPVHERLSRTVERPAGLGSHRKVKLDVGAH